MTKRDFFIIIIKLFALFTLITTIFSVVPSMLTMYQMDFDVYAVIYIIILLTFLSFIFIYLLHHAEKIVVLLKLEKGFDTDTIQIEKLDRKQLIQLGLIIIGGLIFLEHLPDLLTNCFYLFKSMSQAYTELDFRTAENYMYITKDFIAVILGYLVFTNHDKIAEKLF